MKISFFYNIILLFLILLSSTQKINSQCIINKKGWDLVFEDHFNYTDISDLSTNWSFSFNQGKTFRAPCGGTTTMCMTEDNIELLDNKLYLHTTKHDTPIACDGMSADYSCAMIRSKHEEYDCSNSNYPNAEKQGYLYGMFEIRCKLPDVGDGSFPSFWLSPTNAWPPEIDVFEFKPKTPNRFFSTNHWLENNDVLHCSNHYEYPYDLTDDFHTWTLVWTPYKLTWFFDGKELKTIDTNIPASTPLSASPNISCFYRKMNIIINSGMECIEDRSNDKYSPLVVDYVKVYKPTMLSPFLPTTDNIDNYYSAHLLPAYSQTPYKGTNYWNTRRIVSDQEYSVNSNIGVVPGQGKFIYKGEFDLLWNTYWNGTEYVSAPYSWSHQVSGDISVANANATQGSIAFYRKGNEPWYYQEGTFRQINNLNNAKGFFTSNEAGTVLYFIDTNNKIQRCERSSPSSHNWSVEQVGFYSVAGKIIIDPNDVNTIYVRNLLGQILRIKKHPLGWGVISLNSSLDVSTEYALSNDVSKLFYKSSTDGKLYRLSTTNSSSWMINVVKAKYPWTTGEVELTNVKSSLSISSSGNIYYIGTDNRAWIVYSSNNVNYATSIDWTTKHLSSLVLTNLQNGNKLTAVGKDGQIRTFTWGSCEVLNPECDSWIFNITENPSNSITPNEAVSTEKSTFNKNIVKIWPNPVNNILNIEIDDNIKTHNSISLYDKLGRKLKVYKKNTLGNNNFQLDLSSYINGLYYVLINCDEKVYTYKVLKQ